ncbi:hypothetical protein [Nitrosopumilus piranensis]|uniref:Uncharacterized protein n=1 Tax=Nitrosopumilus piranensis TaxID=1582439 RepID=A0A0C5BPT2_9ARCH|nr:hypothetical protein [Nitrosopumilus piranensis]AJM91718.1 exported protein of unknown function [Nitrosopumilus piranensis]
MDKFLFVFFSLFALTLVTPVYADFSISIETDKIQYDFGDTVVVSGNIDGSTENEFIEFMIIGPSGSLVEIGRANIFDNGNFDYSFVTGGPSINSEGKYVIKAGFSEDNLFETKFFIGEIMDDVPVETEVDESNLYQCESEMCVEECEQDPNCTVFEELESQVIFPLSFVDPIIDPQFYVDRYNNELEYKEWFDRNYPDFTIYQAVGLSEPIPEWVRGVFAFWADGQISDEDLKNAIKFLVDSGIIILD